MNSWKEIEEKIKNSEPMPLPIFDLQLLGLSIFVWRRFDKWVEVELVETFPYEPDGQTPLIFVRFAWLELAFENKWLYGKLYYRKHKFYPRGLEQ